MDNSPWPLLAATSAFSITSGLIDWFHHSSFWLLSASLLVLILISAQWWRDVARESAYMGLHSSAVELGLRWGMALFIASEVFFFLSFFWAFFHSSLVASPSIGSQWPPAGVSVFDPLGVPLLNTVILLSSGITVTWAHHALMGGAHSQAASGLKITMALGVIFLTVQAMEYLEAAFAFSDSAYGSTFFMATGFHGLHVLVGASFLLTCAMRLESFNFTSAHHFGFEAAAWYWHFVDVVWLFLFCVVYWWGGL